MPQLRRDHHGDAISIGRGSARREGRDSRVASGAARFKSRLISKATLERRRNSATKRLTSEEDDCLARLAKVFSFALDIYKVPERARVFLGRPRPTLDGKASLDVALATSRGADLAINLLGRVAYGEGVSQAGGPTG